MSGAGVNTDFSVSRNGDTGEATYTDGQINFIIVPNEGYFVDVSCITITGNYKNIKQITDYTNGYRITKISSDIEISISAIPNEEESDIITSFEIITSDGNDSYILYGNAVIGSFDYEFVDGLLTIETENNLELSLSGTYYGSIIINSTTDVQLDLNNVSIYSYDSCPIYVNTEENTEISALSGTTNYIRDYRATVSSDSTTDVLASLYTVSDLKLKGTGELYIYSENNNGIHAKDDLVAQKLDLTVNVVDNALKGNDSVTINSGTYTLIARQGDGIKTSNSSLSSSSKQKGTITINDGNIVIYAACDGMDAAYDIVVNNNPSITIYTDKYSTYSEEITYTSDSIYYIRSTSNTYKYSIYYYNSSTGEYIWKNSLTTPTYTVQSRQGRSTVTYYYYQVDKPSGYDKMIVYVYSSQEQGQSSSYYNKSNQLTVNDNYDTIAYSGSSYSFTNYTTSTQTGGMPGGMSDGNSDKGDYSTKGMKSFNEIIINGGIIYIKSYDDAIHANNDSTLESGVTPTGNVIINGGDIKVYSNDDGIHADGELSITNGNVVVENSYEGIEGTKINVSGGTVKVTSKDDGFNSTLSTGSYGISITGGEIYVYAGGDGLDANTTTSYGGILFDGGKTVVISTSGGNSCIDTEQGYKYVSGYVVAMCPTGMTSECEKVSGSLSSYGKSQNMTLTANYYLTISDMVVVKLPTTISSGYVIELGNKNATISQASSLNYTFDDNGLYWLV